VSDIKQLAERLAYPFGEVVQTDSGTVVTSHKSLIEQLREFIVNESGEGGHGGHESKAPGSVEGMQLLSRLEGGTTVLLVRNGQRPTHHLESDVIAVAAHWHEFSDLDKSNAKTFYGYTVRKAEELLGWQPQPRRLTDCVCFDCETRGTVVIRYTEHEIIGGQCMSRACIEAGTGVYDAARAARLGLQGRQEASGE
jgi:hypothetical protein